MYWSPSSVPTARTTAGLSKPASRWVNPTVRGHGWTFAYLYDETQDVARAFSAACTPDTFVFDGERRLVYRGQLDDSAPGTTYR